VLWQFFGYSVFHLGNPVERLGGSLAILVGVVTVIAIIVGINFVRRHKARLIAEAECALPGPAASP
jgi:hypothetical protein